MGHILFLMGHFCGHMFPPLQDHFSQWIIIFPQKNWIFSAKLVKSTARLQLTAHDPPAQQQATGQGGAASGQMDLASKRAGHRCLHVI